MASRARSAARSRDGATSKAERRLILGLGLTGALPATLSLFRLYSSVGELVVWTALAALVWIPLAARRRVEARIASMAMVGLVAGIVTGLIQTAFAHVIFARDPALAKDWGGVATFGVRLELFFLDVMVGITWGLVVGAVWAGVAALRRRLTRASE
jgi:hypothetical protein